MTTEQHAVPLVTVGVPAFNCGPFIAATIHSALAQDYPNLEVLVVDDASTDDTVEVVRKIADPRVRLVVSDRNVGMAENHNRVLAEAHGELVKILHADDTIEPEAISVLAAGLEDPEVVVATSRRRIIDDVGKTVLTRGPRWPEGRVSSAEVLRRVTRSGTNLLGEPSAALFRRQAAIDAGGFARSELYVLDLDFYARLLKFGDLYFTPRKLANYRVRRDNATAHHDTGTEPDMRRFLERLRADETLGITEADVERGMRRANRDYALRRLFVRAFSVPSTHRERVAFLMAGGWNTAFGYLVFVALWWALSAFWPYWAVLTLTYCISTVMAFVTQKFLVFRSSGNPIAEFPRFASVYVIVLALNVFAFPALKGVLGLNAYVAQLVFTIVVVVFSYTANKYFSFREPRDALVG